GSERRLTEMRRRHVGFVFQFFHLIPELSGEENVLLPARLPGAGRGAARRGAQLIERLGLTGVARQRPHELSGGEQQRFAIALPPQDVARRVETLPGLAAASYRLEYQNVTLAIAGHETGTGVAQVMLGGRRGYAIVAGHDARPTGDEVVIERGLANEWHLRPG